MKRSSVRAFGIALFLVGALYTAIDQFHLNLEKIGIHNNTQTTKTVEKQQSTQKTANESKPAPKEQEKKTQSTNNKQNDTSSNTNTLPKDAVTYTLDIYRNMSIYSISEKLEDAGIIKNALELELFLSKDEYVRNLQIGEFQLNSTMSLKEIADMITKKPSDATENEKASF